MTPRQTRPHTPLDPAALSSAVELIRTAAPRLTVADLADHVGYSPYHFNRSFHASAGITPGQFLTAVRIDMAKRLLLTGTGAVIDVAAEVGFDSLSSFTRRFHVTVGTTPAALRTLADDIADTTIRPFTVGDASQPGVLVRIHLAPELRPGPEVALWIGWFPRPVPVGLPAAGVVIAHVDDCVLPLCPGNPWLFGFVVSRHVDPDQLLIPSRPVYARHPVPITAPGDAMLVFSQAGALDLPLLPALPVLDERGRQLRNRGQTSVRRAA